MTGHGSGHVAFTGAPNGIHQFTKPPQTGTPALAKTGKAGMTRPALTTRQLPARPDQAENEEPQPQVVVALGFLMTNCEPCRSSL